jgi:hypothetical protein
MTKNPRFSRPHTFNVEEFEILSNPYDNLSPLVPVPETNEDRELSREISKKYNLD